MNRFRHSIANARELIDQTYDQLELTWEGAQIQARKYLPFVEERYPQYGDELRGIAEGANVAFDDVLALNTMEAVTMDALHLTRCTSFAVNEQRTADGHILAAHTEDWIPEDEDDVFVVLVKPNDEAPFLAMTYGGLLPNVGFNANGIAQLIDTVYPSDSRIGIPRLVVARAVLAAKRISGAIGRALVAHRAAGYNHLLAHESGEMYSIEVSATRFEILHGTDGFIVHTNHYLADTMKSHGERSGGTDLLARALLSGQPPLARELRHTPSSRCRPSKRTTLTSRIRSAIMRSNGPIRWTARRPSAPW